LKTNKQTYPRTEKKKLFFQNRTLFSFCILSSGLGWKMEGAREQQGGLSWKEEGGKKVMIYREMKEVRGLEIYET
jgi:hypothetical protein